MTRTAWWSRLSLVQSSFKDHERYKHERHIEADSLRDERSRAVDAAFCTRGKRTLKEKMLDVGAMGDWRKRLNQETIKK